MILTGILRHYATVLMSSAPKPLDLRSTREQRSLLHGISLRTNFHVLSPRSFHSRRDAVITAYESGAYLKDPERKGQPPANPMTDPSSMDGMMGMMKNQMAMIIPNTLIMSWINAFFSGYVISEWLTAPGRRKAAGLTWQNSEITLPPDHQVQEYASGWCGNQGHGPEVDVKYQLVLFVHVWFAVCVQLFAWQ